jgi:hypothetical protein
MTKYVVIANLTIADQTKLGFEFKTKIVSNYWNPSTKDNPNKLFIPLYGNEPKLFDDIASADIFAKRLRKYRYDGQQITVASFEAVEYNEKLAEASPADQVENFLFGGVQA